MSDGGRWRASLAVEVWKSSQEWSAQRSVVRSIAWLGLVVFIEMIVTIGSPKECEVEGINPDGNEQNGANRSQRTFKRCPTVPSLYDAMVQEGDDPHEGESATHSARAAPALPRRKDDGSRYDDSNQQDQIAWEHET